MPVPVGSHRGMDHDRLVYSRNTAGLGGIACFCALWELCLLLGMRGQSMRNPLPSKWRPTMYETKGLVM